MKYLFAFAAAVLAGITSFVFSGNVAGGLCLAAAVYAFLAAIDQIMQDSS